jgi:hypothetical protein
MRALAVCDLFWQQLPVEIQPVNVIWQPTDPTCSFWYFVH